MQNEDDNPMQENAAIVVAEPLLMTAQDVAASLKISLRTLWRLLSAGQLIRPVRVGGSTRWRTADVRKWIEEGCRPTDGRKN